MMTNNQFQEEKPVIEVVKPFKDMWLTRKQLKKKYDRDIFEFLNISGRVAGKTVNFIQLMFYNAFKYPNHDIVVLRANSSQLKDSVFKAFRKYCAEKLPGEVFAKIKFKSSPPLLITMPDGNEIMFSGVGLGSQSGSNQSRGKETSRKASLIVFEEVQEIFSGNSNGKELLDHAKLTFLRFLDDEIGKVVYAGNRNKNINDKFNVWVKERENDPNFIFIETSYLDIYQFLNQITIRTIENEKEMNPRNYEYFYLGIPTGGEDLVYGAFTESEHVLPKTFRLEDQQIFQVYIGVDGSSTQDKTIFTPIFHLKNAKLICKIGDMLYHDPKKNGILTNSRLCKVYVKNWLKKLYEKYGLINYEVTMVVDGHNTDLIENLIYELGLFPNLRVHKFTKKDLQATSQKVNNAFSEKILYLTDEEWEELLTNEKIHPSMLFNELQTVCWREDDPTRFNELIPNDMSDSIRYPVAYHAQSPYHIRNLNEKGGN